MAEPLRSPSSAVTTTPTDASGVIRVHGGDTYEGQVRRTLIQLGDNDPDRRLRDAGKYFEACQSAGIDAKVCAATIFTSERHQHEVARTVIKEASESPTSSEWEVAVRRGRGASVHDITQAAGRKPSEVTDQAVIFGDFLDDEKAGAFARRMTDAGYISFWGLRKMAAEAAESGVDPTFTYGSVSFQYLDDAHKFASLLEKQAGNIGTFVGGTVHGATVTSNASRATMEKVLAKHRWRGAYSILVNRISTTGRRIAADAGAEGDPSAMGEANELAPVATESRIEWRKVARDPNVAGSDIELSKRVGAVSGLPEVYKLVGPGLEGEGQEVFLVIPLNHRGELKAPPYEVARGQTARVVVEPRDVMAAVHDCRAEGFIVAHNHPTGRTQPSKADRDLTAAIEKAAKANGVKMADHVVVGHGECVSICTGEVWVAQNGKGGKAKRRGRK